MNIIYTATERFIRYVRINTQSDYTSIAIPSTAQQKDLSELLVKELFEMGIKDAHLDEFGYVFGTIPSNTEKQVPVICFCSHVDTSPDCSGKNVKPIFHSNYNGEDLVLPDDKSVVLRMSEHPDLKNQIGNDIITASGTTLLGADNKAGVAAIMDAANFLMLNPDVKHGTIKILFTPDEEIGRGVNHLDIKKLAADFGYTIDGETLGSFEDETFSADAMQVKITGVSTHPGFAKGKMQNAIKIAAAIIAALPKDRLSPESTEDRAGFIHPINMEGQAEEAKIDFIIRDFDDEKLNEHEEELKNICLDVIKPFPGASIDFAIEKQYRNMKKVIEKYPQVSEFALKAIERAGVRPIKRSIRGGTDGSRLSFMGLPCPNIFAGEHAFHSKQEWVSVQDMQAAVRTIINLAMIWEEEAEG